MMDNQNGDILYLDNAATTPEHSGGGTDNFVANASSRTHILCLNARKEVDAARQSVADLFGVPAGCVVFTSGATESLLILGRWAQRIGSMVLANATEHAAMLMVAEAIEEGSLPNQDVTGKVYGRMVVNNEVGTIHNDWNNAKERGAAYTIADATQAIGKVDIDLEQMGIDYLVGSAHKFHGPTGCGFIVARDRKLLSELVDPATRKGQEKGIRPGTLNAKGIIATGHAVQWLQSHKDEYREQLRLLQSTFETEVMTLTTCEINESDKPRAPHITSLYLPGVDNEALISAVSDRMAIASGSACTSEKVEASHVLMALYNDQDRAESTVRISYGWQNTIDEVKEAAKIIAEAAAMIRSFA